MSALEADAAFGSMLGSRRRFTARRVVLGCTLSGWVLATLGVALRMIFWADSDLQRVVDDANRQSAAGARVINVESPTPWFLLTFLLLYGALIVLGLMWAIAFSGGGYRRRGTIGVVLLFAVGFLGLWLSKSAYHYVWWHPSIGHRFTSQLGLWGYMATQEKAAGGLLLIDVVVGAALLVILLRRPARHVAVATAPPGWYPSESGVRYWNGTAWTQVTGGHPDPSGSG